jgi:hypothetical protein
MTDWTARAKLIAGLAVVGLLGLALAGRGAASQDWRSRLELVGVSTPFAERAGADDGMAFAVHFMGDTRGSLDTCG